MNLPASFSSHSHLTKALLLILLMVPLLHARDAYRSLEIRRDVTDGLRQALVSREQVARGILAQPSRQDMDPKELVAGLAIEVEPLHKVVTLRYLSHGIDGGSKTLVWVPLAIAKDGTRSLVERGQVPLQIGWVCLSSLSAIKEQYPWVDYRGTLNSKYAPAECRY